MGELVDQVWLGKCDAATGAIWPFERDALLTDFRLICMDLHMTGMSDKNKGRQLAWPGHC